MLRRNARRPDFCRAHRVGGDVRHRDTLRRLTEGERLRFKRLHEENALYFGEFLDA